MSENRQHSRVRISFPVRCEGIASRKPFYTVFKDISTGGIKLVSETFIGINKRVQFEINLVNELVKGRGRIAWCNSQPYSERYLVGVEFTEMDPAVRERLSAFLSNITSS